MNKIIKGNTDFIVILFTVASIGLTFVKIMDVKDLVMLIGMVFAYQFGKTKVGEKPIATELG